MQNKNLKRFLHNEREEIDIADKYVYGKQDSVHAIGVPTHVGQPSRAH